MKVNITATMMCLSLRKKNEDVLQQTIDTIYNKLLQLESEKTSTIS